MHPLQLGYRKNGLLKIPYFLLVILFEIFPFFGCRKIPDEVKMADYLMKQHLTTGNDSLEISQLVDTLLVDTRWKGKFQVNRVFDREKVNIFIVQGNSSAIDSDPLTMQLSGNGLYVGNNIIFLDDDYLRSFLENHHVTADPHSTGLIDDQRCFLYWIIGHELGHLVCGHLHGHFDAGSLDKFVKTSSLDNKQELQADSVFVRTILKRKRLRFSEQRLMMNMLNNEIEQKIGKVQTAGAGIIYDYTNKQVVTYARQPTHPEYVVRLSRMLELSSKMGRDTGLSNLVGGFIKQLREIH